MPGPAITNGSGDRLRRLADSDYFAGRDTSERRNGFLDRGFTGLSSEPT